MATRSQLSPTPPLLVPRGHVHVRVLIRLGPVALLLVVVNLGLWAQVRSFAAVPTDSALAMAQRPRRRSAPTGPGIPTLQGHWDHGTVTALRAGMR